MNPWLGALVVLLAVAVSTGGGWAVTRLVLRLASRSSDAGGTTTDAAPAATRPASDETRPVPDVAQPASDETQRASAATGPAPGTAGPATDPTDATSSPPASVESAAGDGPEGPASLAALRGGTWIGLLERLATTGALLYGEPTAIAVVVAVKGLGRYPELREHPTASERFVIGSLASLTWAAGIGFLGRWLLTR